MLFSYLIKLLHAFRDRLDRPDIETVQITWGKNRVLLDIAKDGNQLERWTIEPSEDFNWEGLRKDVSMCILERKGDK